METSNYQLIDKEAIAELKFPESDVLSANDAQKERIADLNRALSLGNLEQHKIKIYFEDNVSHKVVNTTIWGLTDKRVILKKGVVIPINRVHKVKF
jgi:hypothetical protein